MILARARKRVAVWLRRRADQIYAERWQDRLPGIVRESKFSLYGPDWKTSVRVELANGEFYEGEVHPVMSTWVPKPPTPGPLHRPVAKINRAS